MCLGRLPSFKVAALKIAGNGCGVQVWLKGPWWNLCVVYVCAHFQACTHAGATVSVTESVTQGSIVVENIRHVERGVRGRQIASSDPGTVAQTSI